METAQKRELKGAGGRGSLADVQQQWVTGCEAARGRTSDNNGNDGLML